MKIRRDLAERAIAGLAGRLGLGVPQTAQGILSVVTANMARAIRVISVQRGHDPRDYTLMAFGGAGPLHAARLARELEIGRVLVPANPGILCAMGLLLTDLRADFAATRLMPATEASTADVAEGFAALAERAERWFEHEGIASADRRITRTVDMRYHGQNYELQRRGARRPDLHGDPAGAGGGFRRRAPPALRLRRRRRSGADRHPARRGDRRGAQGRASGASRSRTGRGRRHRAAPSGVAGRRRATSSTRRSMPATRCARATASPVPRSSSRWTPRRSCRPAGRRGSIA